MARKTNYGFERREREKARALKKADRQRAKKEKSNERKDEPVDSLPIEDLPVDDLPTENQPTEAGVIARVLISRQAVLPGQARAQKRNLITPSYNSKQVKR